MAMSDLMETELQTELLLNLIFVTFHTESA
jgi:hypothetical protein